MKKKCLSLILMVFSLSLFAQEWTTNFEEAKQQALKNHENIVLVFQGSDWCAPCMKLDKEIWSTTEFQKLSKGHFIMLKADFPRRKANKLPENLTKQNAQLAEKYNSEGFFPLVVVLNSKGEVLGKMGYEKVSPAEYYKKLTTFEI